MYFIRFGFTTKPIGEHCSPLHLFIQTVTILRSGIICFFITNYLHERGTAARRAGVQWTPLLICGIHKICTNHYSPANAKTPDFCESGVKLNLYKLKKN